MRHQEESRKEAVNSYSQQANHCVNEFVETLIQWAMRDGKEAELADLPGAEAVTLNQCFSPHFMEWLLRRGKDIPLSYFRDLPLAEFRSRLKSVKDRDFPLLHQKLRAFNQGDKVLWKFARIIGEVSLYAEHEETCPVPWIGTHREIIFQEVRRLLSRLYEEDSGKADLGQPHTIGTSEHLPLLKVALRESRERLLIISPWIRLSVVNREFIRSLENLLEHGVQVFIGYGYGKDTDQWKSEIHVVRILQELADRYEVFYFKRFKSIHAKVLISDWKFAITASFNWLSFGARDSDRIKRGHIVYEPQSIENQFRYWYHHFIEEELAKVEWSLKDPPKYEIEFLETVPVWIERHTSLSIQATDSELLEEARLELKRFPSFETLEWLKLADLPSDRQDGELNINLDQLFRRKGRYGHFKLELHFVQATVKRIDPLEFIRLPEIQVTHQKDPRYPDLAFCVKIGGVGFKLQPHEGTEISEYVVTSTQPFLSQPEVRLDIILDEHVTLPVRILLRPPNLTELKDEIGAIAADVREKSYDFQQLQERYQEIKRTIPNIPEKHFLLAEMSYRIARVSRSSLTTAHNHLNEYSRKTTEYSSQARLLDTIVSLHLNWTPDSPTGCQEVDSVIKSLDNIHSYLNTPIGEWKARINWQEYASLLEIWHPADRIYVKLCVAQANREIEVARKHLDELIKMNMECLRLDLLQARQYRLEGRLQEARAIYKHLSYNSVSNEIIESLM